MKRTIRLRIGNPRTESQDALQDFDITADVEDGYAIHRTVLSWPIFGTVELSSNEWTVTHAKSGIAVRTGFKSFEQAESARAILRTIHIGGVTFGDMPTCEAIDMAPRFARKFARKWGIDPARTEEYAMRKRLVLAKILCAEAVIS